MNIIYGIICLLILQETAASPSAAVDASVVDIGYAKYQGTVIQDPISNATHTQFLGIRYAAPPTGMARFREPSLPATIPSIQQANFQPPICFQSGLGAAPMNPYSVGNFEHNFMRRADVPASGPVASEDCLFLNVYIPGDISEKKRNLPVIVWIHGGGYVQGSESITGYGGVYDGNAIIRESGEGVILVTLQYRLGLFGFLAGQKVKKGGALNAGLLDQQFALKWVQTHIDKFGGNPRQVTLWGQSAGAGSVLQHMIANGGQTNPQLFRAAITSSTFLPSQYKFDDRIPETLYNQTVAQTNCFSSTDSLQCLRRVDVDVLQAANVAIITNGFFGTVDFVPVIDGTLIRDRPTQLLKQRKLNGEFLYSVTNTFEGSIFVDPTTADTVQVQQFISQLFPTLGLKDVQAAAVQYAGLGSNITQAISILGESLFICPTYYLQTAFGGKGYKGLFAVPPGSHGVDLLYYFPGSVTPGGGDLPFANPEFVKAFTESFPNFATSQDPNKKWEDNITPFWNTWSGLNEMLFNKTEAGSSDIRSIETSKALLDRCSFWESVSTSTSQ